MRRLLHLTNALLAAIALLLAAIAILLYQQRPVTMGQMVEAGESGDDDRQEAVRKRMPLTRIANSTLDVEITNTPVPVDIER